MESEMLRNKFSKGSCVSKGRGGREISASALQNPGIQSFHTLNHDPENLCFVCLGCSGWVT